MQRRKLLVVSGYTLSVITRPFYILTSTVAGALGLRFLDRVGKGLRDSPRDAMISLSTPKEELGRSFGYHRAMDTLGAILGPLVAYLVLSAFPLRFDVIFLLAFGVGTVALFTLFFIKDIAGIVATKRLNVISSFGALPLQFKLYLLAIFILSVGTLPVAVLLLKTESIGLVIADIPLFYMLYNLSYAGFSISAGKMSDRIGAHAVIFLGYALLMVSYLVLSWAHSLPALVVGFLLLGLFSALTDGVQRAFASRLTTEDVRGGALGCLNAANGFGALVAGAGGGFLWQTYSPSVAFAVAAIVLVVGVAMFFASAKTSP